MIFQTTTQYWGPPEPRPQPSRDSVCVMTSLELPPVLTVLRQELRPVLRPELRKLPCGGTVGDPAW